MFYALRELGNVVEGQTVLIHSAAGGCGTFALGICKQLKVKVVATVGSEEKVLFVQTSRWLSLSFCKSWFEMQTLQLQTLIWKLYYFSHLIFLFVEMTGEVPC